MRELRSDNTGGLRTGLKKYFVALPVFALFFGFLLLVSPTVKAENEYSCGTYGAGSYGQSCPTTPVDPTDPTDPTDPGSGGNNGGSSGGGSSSGGTSGGSSSTGGSGSSTGGNSSSGGSSNTGDGGTNNGENPTGDGSILLNSFSSYSSTEGKTLDLKLEQQVFFVVNGDRHTITVKTITDEYIIVTIASTPTDVRVNKGETVEHDVDGDGKADIAISYLNATTVGASVNFWQLSSATDEKPEATGSTSDGANLWWVWVLIGLVGVAIVVFTAVSAAKRKKNA